MRFNSSHRGVNAVRSDAVQVEKGKKRAREKERRIGPFYVRMILRSDALRLVSDYVRSVSRKLLLE